jgi:hypothetical protein
MGSGVFGKGYPIRISSGTRSFSKEYTLGLDHISMTCVICKMYLYLFGTMTISADFRRSASLLQGVRVRI